MEEEKEVLQSEQPEVESGINKLKTVLENQKRYVQRMDLAKLFSAAAGLIIMFRTNAAICAFAERHDWISALGSFALLYLSMDAMEKFPSYKIALVLPALLSVGFFYGTPSFVNGFGKVYLFEPILVFASTTELTYAKLRLRKEWSLGVVLAASYLAAGVVGAAYYQFVPNNGLPGNGIFLSLMVPAVYLMMNQGSASR